MKQRSFFPTLGSPTRTPFPKVVTTGMQLLSLPKPPTAWYLYTNSYHAIVIPKRVVADDDEIKEAERLFADPSSPGCVIVMKPGFKICRNKHIGEVCGKDYSIALTKFSELFIIAEYP